jgi:hypothetical protein
MISVNISIGNQLRLESFPQGADGRGKDIDNTAFMGELLPIIDHGESDTTAAVSSRGLTWAAQ